MEFLVDNLHFVPAFAVLLGFVFGYFTGRVIERRRWTERPREIRFDG